MSDEERRRKPLVLEKQGKVLAGVIGTLLVLTGGIWAGFALRRRRLGTYRNPYESPAFQRYDMEGGEYEMVGI